MNSVLVRVSSFLVHSFNTELKGEAGRKKRDVHDDTLRKHVSHFLFYIFLLQWW